MEKMHQLLQIIFKREYGKNHARVIHFTEQFILEDNCVTHYTQHSLVDWLEMNFEKKRVSNGDLEGCTSI